MSKHNNKSIEGKKDEFTVCMIGDTGVGKSSFGNALFDEEMFQANDSPDPVTLKAVEKFKEYNDHIMHVIDTEGLNDGNSINSEQIKNLAKLMKNYELGVNVVSIILNGRCPRFSQGVKDIIQFSYNAFATKRLLNHICIVFTNCDNPKFPNRCSKKTEFMEKVRKYLSEISNTALKKVPLIPCYFVDCYSDGNNQETNQNMEQFKAWCLSKKALSTNGFKEAGYHEIHKTQYQTKYIKTITRGNTTYDLYEDQKRTKIIPNNKDPARYTDWICIRKFKEPVTKLIIQRKNSVDLGNRFSNDGKIRYKATVDQEREITKDLKTNHIIKKTGWYDVSDIKYKETGRITQRIEKRPKKFERKDVIHHSGHGLFGGRNHTHVHLIHIEFIEERTLTIDFDGKTVIYESDWKKVVGSEKSYEVGSWEEGGHTPGYLKDISN